MLSDKLKRLHACADAQVWIDTQPDEATAWQACDRGDWMLWLIGKQSGPPESDGRKKLVLCACECARLALPIFEKRKPGD